MEHSMRTSYAGSRTGIVFGGFCLSICSHKISTRDQSNFAEAASNPPFLAVRNQDPRLTQYFWDSKSVHPKQHFDPFSRFCTVKPSSAA